MNLKKMFSTVGAVTALSLAPLFLMSSPASAFDAPASGADAACSKEFNYPVSNGTVESEKFTNNTQLLCASREIAP